MSKDGRRGKVATRARAERSIERLIGSYFKGLLRDMDRMGIESEQQAKTMRRLSRDIKGRMLN